MAIQTTGELQNIFNKYDSKSWLKSSSVEGGNEAGFDIKMPLDGAGASGRTMSFGEVLSRSIGEVNGLQVEANQAIQKLASGKSKNLHETLLTVERADIALKQMNQIRMKVVEAYKEIMRMQV